MIPPGLAFLASRAHKLFLPPILVYFAAGHLQFTTSRLTLVILCLSSIPALTILSGYVTRLRHYYEARSMGAELVPVVRGKLPGNIDILYQVITNWKKGYLDDDLRELLERYGTTFNMRLLWEDRIFTAEPDHIKAVLATDFQNHIKGERFIFSMKSLLGTGVFNSDGDMWKFHRAMTRPYFSRDRISDFDTFSRHADEALSVARAQLNTGRAIDYQDLVARFTLDSATEFLFGYSIHSIRELSEGNQTANAFARAFGAAQDQVALRTRVGPTWPLSEFWKDKTTEHMKVINAFIDPIMEDALEKKAALKANGKLAVIKEEEAETLLSHLVETTEDKKIIKDELLNILLAGRDTTAATLTMVTYFLAIHPEVLAKLRAEILTTLGTTKVPTVEDLRDLKYLRAVINETLRLYPPVPFNVRETINPAVWTSPTGKRLYIPGNTTVPYSVFAMHHSKELWGPDADIFDPERFLDDRLKKYVTPNPFIFLPFNAGPRICLGQQFAYNESSFFLVRQLQMFDSIELAPECQPEGTKVPASWASSPGRKGMEKFWPKSHLTTYAKGGLWVRMKEASQTEGV